MKLLDEAIEQLRELPEDEQERAAEVLFAYISSEERQHHLSADQADEVRKIRGNLAVGTTRFATDQEVAGARSTR
jgi:hypothetical protein